MDPIKIDFTRVLAPVAAREIGLVDESLELGGGVCEVWKADTKVGTVNIESTLLPKSVRLVGTKVKVPCTQEEAFSCARRLGPSTHRRQNMRGGPVEFAAGHRPQLHLHLFSLLPSEHVL